MVIYILDASAVMRYLDGESGADRVDEILDLFQSRNAYALISAMHWGEVVGILFRRHGVDGAAVQLSELNDLQLTIVAVTAERAERCARIKAQHRITYVDSLAVELAEDTLDSVLITADFDFKSVEHLIPIEFLPPKPLKC